MHEVSLIESVVGLIEEERRKQAFSRVSLVRLAVGLLGHVEPEALRFCFESVTRGTIAEGARLEIEEIVGEGWCCTCRRTVRLDERYAECPECGDGQVFMTAGGELLLSELEVE
jgi:hydrogenase nickel incorporation protein HypA/HybF